MQCTHEGAKHSQAYSEYPPQRCAFRSSQLPTSVPLVLSAVMQCMLEAEASSPERAGEAIYENPRDATAPACVRLRSGQIVSAKVEWEAQLRVDGPHAALEKGRMNSREGYGSNMTWDGR
jgi:hypothetical protein